MRKMRKKNEEARQKCHQTAWSRLFVWKTYYDTITNKSNYTGRLFGSDEDCLTVRPKPEVIELLNKEFDKQGSDITIYTARKESFRENTKKWLVLHGVKYHHLEMEKLPWGEYWDSDAVRPEELLPIKYTVSD